MSSNKPAKNYSPLLRIAVQLREVVRVLVSDGYPCIAGGIFVFVCAGGDHFRNSTGPFIAVFCLFLATFLGSVGKKRVKIVNLKNTT